MVAERLRVDHVLVAVGNLDEADVSATRWSLVLAEPDSGLAFFIQYDSPERRTGAWAQLEDWLDGAELPAHGSPTIGPGTVGPDDGRANGRV